MRRLIWTLAFMTTLTTGAGAQDWSLPTEPFDATATVVDRPTFSQEVQLDFERTLMEAIRLNDVMSKHRPQLEALALDLMLDPRAAFEFFRDEIVTQVYPGHLRGPRALFEAGAGNAYDKSIALATVLQNMGYDTRIMTANATDAFIGELNAQACQPTRGASPDVFRIAGLNGAVLSRIKARAHAGYSALSAVTAPQAGQNTSSAEQAAHYWVQARIGSDWVDFDPSLPTAEAGQAVMGPGEELLTPPDPHKIRLTLTVETLRGGVLRTSDILSHSFELPRDAERSVTLLFGPEARGTGGIAGDTLAAVQGQAAQLVAVLMLDEDTKNSRAFAAPGVAAAAGGLFDAGQDEVTTALYLTLTSSVPGQQDRSARRTVFDIVGADLRDTGEEINPDDLSDLARGERYALPLESVRHIVISHGGLSGHVASVRVGAMLADLLEVDRAMSQGVPDPLATIWNGWVQASTLALASEELVRARPIDKGCVTLTMPRALIWGAGPVSRDQAVFWSDWVLDDIEIINAQDPGDAAKLRMWHGAVQAGLEREALLMQFDVPNGTVPIDVGTLRELSQAEISALGPDALADQASGFALYGSSVLPEDEWWRIDPEIGRADARVAYYGNAGKMMPAPGQGNMRAGVKARDSLSRRYFNSGNARNWEAYMRRVQYDAEQLAKRWEIRDRLKRGRGNEYLMLLLTVSIPVSMEAGSAIGGAVNRGLMYAL